MSDAPEGSKNPVILLHGILGQRHVYWNLFKHRLSEDGIRHHECILPYALLGDMRIAARFVSDKVDATLRGDNARKVDLICHSAGGLVARYYLMFMGGHKKVDRIITMGTPHRGTYFAYLMGFPMALRIAKQTRPGSHFLDEISGPGAIPPGVKCYNLWSPIDGIVMPAQNAKWTGAHQVRMDWTTHWSFLWQRGVHDTVLAALEDRLVTTHGQAAILPEGVTT